MLKMLPPKRQIKSEQEYCDWLKSLEPGELCFVQEFHPKNKSVLDIDYEFWSYSVVKIFIIKEDEIIATGHIFNSQNHEHFFINGMKTYSNAREVRETGHFYCRLVKLAPELLPKDFDKESYKEYNFDWFAANLPIYEPQFKGERVFLLQPFKGQSKSLAQKKLITSNFPSYSYKVSDGYIIVCFPGAELAFEFEGWLKENDVNLLQYLYTEEL